MQVTSPFDCGCDFAQAAPAHHARLLLLEREPFAIIGELIETAATWGEVEHGVDEPVIEPSDWLAFVERHEWEQPDQVHEMMLSLWSVTLPCSHDVARARGAGSTQIAGSVTEIETARNRRSAEQSA
ncbi:MAG: hypothetical protein ACE37B_11865 [Ilumatobacter sp.]|uniref:hypothetical protein n=1 Tax=Ilumatobacter sp. TaxID=1967498 RepID=UPI00391CC063